MRTKHLSMSLILDIKNYNDLIFREIEISNNTGKINIQAISQYKILIDKCIAKLEENVLSERDV